MMPIEVPAAVDADGLPGHEVRVAEEQHGLRDLRLAAPSAERRRRGHLGDLLGAGRAAARIGPGAIALTRMRSRRAPARVPR